MNSTIYKASSYTTTNGENLNTTNKPESATELPQDHLTDVYTTSKTKGKFMEEEDLYNQREKRFRDRARIEIMAGKGGNGCVSYYRDRLIISGAPDGGDGGKGGSFYLQADSNFSDLSMIKAPILQGNNGRSGSRSKQDGKVGSDIHYRVPLGTLVWELKTTRKPDKGGTERDYPSEINKKLIADLDESDKAVLVCRGGGGGHGNAKHRGVRAPGKGTAGERKHILLELKTLADIGLVGYPNAGKSTLLATLTRAFPKIASYPFTTLVPTVGKIRFIDEFYMTMADIPGLIEGSHQNKGLGHEFLRHVERTKLLVYVLDMTAESVTKEYMVLKNELEKHSVELGKKPSMIVCNKMDLESKGEEKLERLRELFGKDVYGISAKYSLDLDKFVVAMRKMVEKCRKEERIAKENERILKKQKEATAGFTLW